jgi:hypothetical protein
MAADGGFATFVPGNYSPGRFLAVIVRSDAVNGVGNRANRSGGRRPGRAVG